VTVNKFEKISRSVVSRRHSDDPSNIGPKATTRETIQAPEAFGREGEVWNVAFVLPVMILLRVVSQQHESNAKGLCLFQSRVGSVGELAAAPRHERRLKPSFEMVTIERIRTMAHHTSRGKWKRLEAGDGLCHRSIGLHSTTIFWRSSGLYISTLWLIDGFEHGHWL
jgi:hypothetical protein